MHPDVEAKVRPVLEEFRKKMLAQGYSESAVEMALKRAREYIEGVSRMAGGKHPELVKRIELEILPEALEHSEKYLLGMYGVFAPKKATIYGRKYWEKKLKEVIE